MKNSSFPFLITLIVFFAACSSEPGQAVNEAKAGNVTSPEKAASSKPIANAATILAKKQVPVLCYHHIRNFSSSQSESMKSYSVTPAAFEAQMKILHDSGYQTILPNQLYEYLVHDAEIPAKPIMISFDDTQESQYIYGATEMAKYGFKGVYFIMTISINRPRYMSKEQIKNLSDSGHVIASHTWDHHMVTKYVGADWDTQLVKPQQQLQAITNKPVQYFAYPFGLWNEASIPEIKNRNYQMTFSLSGKRDSLNPLFTVRRMIVPGTWTAPGMLKAMKTTFKL